MLKLLFSITGIVLFAELGLAHSGHGATSAVGATHYLVEPLHALPWVAVLGLMILFHRTRKVARVRSERL